jgi:hypothetical protein
MTASRETTARDVVFHALMMFLLVRRSAGCARQVIQGNG